MEITPIITHRQPKRYVLKNYRMKLLTSVRHIQKGDFVDLTWPCNYRVKILEIQPKGYLLEKADGYNWIASRRFLRGKISAIHREVSQKEIVKPEPIFLEIVSPEISHGVVYCAEQAKKLKEVVKIANTTQRPLIIDCLRPIHKVNRAK
jgi:hypothetical protein